MSTKHTIIKFRRGTAAEWSASEPQPGGEVLKLGEPGWEKDTGKLKIGDGVTGWNNLPYLQAENDGDVILTEENVDDAVGNLLVGGSGIGVNYNDNLDTLTISVSGLTSSLITDFNESVQDNLNTSLVAGSGIALTYDSGAETLTISSSGITLEEVQDNLGNSFLVAGNGVGLSYSDAGNSLTISVEDAPRIVTTVFNETGFQIAKMQAVYIGGGHGDLPTVELAIATGDVTSAGTYGLTYQAIDNMGTGEVIVFGALTGVNTDPAHGGIAGATEGSTLYLSPTTPGGLTTTKPSAPNHMVVIGTVVRVHQNEGVIEVRIQNGYELDELHNVAISGATNGQFLQYNSSSQLWVPSSSGNFSTLQVSGTNVSVSGHTHISSNITDFTEAVQDVVGASGFLVGASGISISYNDAGNTLTITGGGGATISNAGDNRILTSDGTSTGINGESNLTFDGTTLGVTGVIDIDNLRLDSNTISSTNSNGNIVLAPNGTGDVQIDADTLRVGDTNALATITTNGTGNLVLNTNGGTNSGSITIQQGANNDIILEPNGNGQIQASSGGNARGTNAIDLQIARGGNNANVAGGTLSALIGGLANRTTNSYSFVGGGNNNINNGFSGSIIGGGSNSLGSFSNSTICGGSSNTVNGDYSAIIGGQNNLSAGGTNVILAGSNNTNQGNYSTILGGISNKIYGYGATYGTILGGKDALCSIRSEVTHANGSFYDTGDAQTRKFILKGIVRNPASSSSQPSSGNDQDNNNDIYLTLTATSQSNRNNLGSPVLDYIRIPNFTSWDYEVRVIARHKNSNNTSQYKFTGSIKSLYNSAIILNPVKTVLYEDDPNDDCNLSIELLDEDDNYTSAENPTLPFFILNAVGTAEEVLWIASIDVIQVSIPAYLIACNLVNGDNTADGYYSIGGTYNGYDYFTNNGYYIWYNSSYNSYTIGTGLGYEEVGGNQIVSGTVYNGTWSNGGSTSFDNTLPCPQSSSSVSSSTSSSGSGSSSSSSSSSSGGI